MNMPSFRKRTFQNSYDMCQPFIVEERKLVRREHDLCQRGSELFQRLVYFHSLSSTDLHIVLPTKSDFLIFKNNSTIFMFLNKAKIEVN